MKKISVLFLVILMLIAGLTGCDRSDASNSNGLSQKELWDKLDDYQRYLSVWGGQDAALVFTNDDDLVFDYSFYLGEQYSLYFTELISFKEEGDDHYKLEYKNPYPDSFESSIFYIDLSAKDNTKFSFGMYQNGKLIYIDVFADVGLTAEELFAGLAKYNSWLDEDVYGGFIVKAHDKNKFDLGLVNSDFWLQGTISNVKYNGYMSYTLSVDHPGYEGDEMTDPYDPYTADYSLYFNPHFELLIIHLNEQAVEFVPEIGFTASELFEELAKYNSWMEVGTDVYGGYFVKAHDKDKFDLGLMNSGFWQQGTIVSIKYNGNMNYTISVDYPGYEGDEMTDPYDPYTAEYNIFYYPSNEILVIELYNEIVEFAPEKVLTADDLFAELAGYNVWYEYLSENYRGYFIKAYDKNKFDLGLDDSGFWISGTISKIEYNGFMSYTVTVDYPGYEGDEMTDPYDPYTVNYYFYYNPDIKLLRIMIGDDIVEFFPDRGQ
ncbi:MAG TPA: hypothetical protein PK631_00560 [Erysipelotrichaceae bacterium]|nr:hypothetical protein [Erysipelotrichaceae bacterium]